MKRYILLLPIIISACASNPTSPAGPSHPFPKTFKQVAVSFRNLPEHWEKLHEHWDYSRPPQIIDDVTVDSGSGNGYSGDWLFSFDSNAFKQRGDTTEAPGLTLVVNQDSSKIDFLQISKQTATGWMGNSMGVTCGNTFYQADTLGQVVVKLSGQAVQSALSFLGTSSSGSPGGRVSGDYYSNYEKYTYLENDSASLTIRFIP